MVTELLVSGCVVQGIVVQPHHFTFLYCSIRKYRFEVWFEYTNLLPLLIIYARAGGTYRRTYGVYNNNTVGCHQCVASRCRSRILWFALLRKGIVVRCANEQQNKQYDSMPLQHCVFTLLSILQLGLRCPLGVQRNRVSR